MRHWKSIVFKALNVLPHVLQNIAHITILALFVQVLLYYFCDMLASPLHDVEEGVQQQHRLTIQVFLIQRDWLHGLVLGSVAQQGRLDDQDEVLN